MPGPARSPTTSRRPVLQLDWVVPARASPSPPAPWGVARRRGPGAVLRCATSAPIMPFAKVLLVTSSNRLLLALRAEALRRCALARRVLAALRPAASCGAPRNGGSRNSDTEAYDRATASRSGLGACSPPSPVSGPRSAGAPPSCAHHSPRSRFSSCLSCFTGHRIPSIGCCCADMPASPRLRHTCGLVTEPAGAPPRGWVSAGGRSPSGREVVQAQTATWVCAFEDPGDRPARKPY